MTIRATDLRVKKTDTTSTDILRGISCAMEQGTITLVVGKTGAGKTTLLDALSGLIKPTSGWIEYADQPLWRGKRLNHCVALTIGCVFQFPEHFLFARTVRGEFAYSLRPLRLPRQEVEARAADAMVRVHLAHALLAASPLTLSGGQKRRVAIASTLATMPMWLFLDEPTAGLDAEGSNALLTYLREWRTRGGGAIVATHDLDALLPICDHVLILRDGTLLAQATPAELCRNPAPLLQADIGLPSALQAKAELMANGWSLPEGCLSAAALAAALAAQHSPRAMPAHTPRAERPERPSTASQHQRPRVADTLDPRTKWLLATFISVGILLTPTWGGILYGAAVIVLLIALLRLSIKELIRWLRPMMYFIVISVALSGLVLHIYGGRLTGIGFAVAPAVGTLKQWSRLLAVMALGLLLPLTTSHQQLKQGLQAALSHVPGTKRTAEAFALATALTLRFIPVLAQEVERFSKVARARGKSRVKPGRLRARDLPTVMVPLLIAMFQLADHMTIAMEARGYRKIGQRHTAAVRLKLTRRDAIAIFIGLVAALPLYILR